MERSHNARGRESSRASPLGWCAALVCGLALTAATGAAHAETPELADRAFELSARVRDLGSEYRPLYQGVALEGADEDDPAASEPTHKPLEHHGLGTHRVAPPANEAPDDAPDDR